MKRILVDTNVLVLFIVGNLDATRLGRGRLREFSAETLDRANEIASSYPGHVSTPNILTEASNLIGSGDQEICSGAAGALAGYVARLDEIYVPSVDAIAGSAYRKFGLADTTVVHAARRGDVVLTADGPLFGFLANLGLRPINLWHPFTPL